jgi:hypothetical protein
MPIFTSNYQDVISSDLPDARHLKYNDAYTALRIFNKKRAEIGRKYSHLIDDPRITELVGRLASRLSVDKPEKFALGPSVSYSAVFDPKKENVKVYMVASLFGGGSVENLGINKVALTQDEQKNLWRKFNSSESAAIEDVFDRSIQDRLKQEEDLQPI